ncbi:hypothetical protein BMR07_12275 [Methylococcaceae bacterium CS1]|uniref:hypothetical protein n=1 Tax=Bathymodiolus platifrons methanotrophic gill symbiont TaxID=113268 RepID=UPI0011CB8D2B|nr:hypothetical protein [Bathymodiolus platifrons methanotrophic gill symbiont]TXK96440.1 hypothetical protein BMR11_11775 [Methylococcaceae bacterium CS5]TXL03719.1 hypothetical protein BMR09_14300 [Methylococcaceae bacterium CS3]TXL04517.1 hypothetical protein BMR07_12275 [Methylococcaceae bacterium CS1]TXL09677.1 hypothetical protein BMR08_12810 [Methylococcaceae bacterium CS2]
MATSNGSTAIRDKILASLARYRALRIGKFPCAFWRLSSRPGLTADEVDLILDWQVFDSFSLSAVLAVAIPGEAARQFTGGGQTWFHSMLYASWEL